MDHKVEFEKRAQASDKMLDMFLFGWIDGEGNSGDYGLIDGLLNKTFETLINTTYAFQPEPKFTLQCRLFKMNMDQFTYLQDHDLDTEDFLSTIGALPDVAYSLDLANHKDAASALEQLAELCPTA